MNNVWIIAQTGNESSQLLGEDISTEEQSNAVTSQDGSNDNTENTDTDKDQKPGLPSWIFLPVIALMIIMLFRAPQKQKQQRKKLEQSLEKNDRVLTIGGIIGTIVEIKDDEITLKVDESNNTKIKLKRSAIGRNMSKD